MTNFDVEPYYDKLIELTKDKRITWGLDEDKTPTTHRNDITVKLENMGFTASGVRYCYTGNEHKHSELMQLVRSHISTSAIELFLKD